MTIIASNVCFGEGEEVIFWGCDDMPSHLAVI